ncbi:MAG TPA: hypothetical protein VFW23_16420 [Tepidisphaeraceae bacterium]|nr:hypothetical protein [Tepidisphaeraceae bacterium]
MHFLIAATNLGGQGQFLNDFVLPAIPWVLIVVFFLLFLGPLSRRQRQRAAEANQRAFDHWDRLEKKLDRIIEILDRGPV